MSSAGRGRRSLVLMPDAVHVALARSLLECLAFLELSDDETVDARLAVKTMERASHWLGELSETDRAILVSIIQEVAATERAGPVRDFYLSVPDGIGLVDEDVDERHA
jgi:hypothetical protein